MTTSAKMQLAIPIHKFDVNNVYFLDKKRNVVIDGDFIKIIYSDQNVELSELYLFCTEPLENDGFVMMRKTGGGGGGGIRKLGMDRTSVKSSELIARLCYVEEEILNKYIISKAPNKIPMYNLRMQLGAGFNIPFFPGNTKSYILKIAGLWETDTNVGITLKFISSQKT
jgi:hypothetical protein